MRAAAPRFRRNWPHCWPAEMTLALPLAAGSTVLRRLCAADLADFQAYRHDPEVGRYQGWLPQDDAAALAFLQHMADVAIPHLGGWCQLAIAEHDSGRLAGDIGLYLTPDGSRAEIGFSLARTAQGRGMATAALRALLAQLFADPALQAVTALTDARNLPAQALLLRLGFAEVRREAAEFRGQPCIELHYLLSRPQG